MENYFNYCTNVGGNFFIKSLTLKASSNDMAMSMFKSRFRKSLFMDNWERQNFFKFIKISWSTLTKHEILLYRDLELEITKYVFERENAKVWNDLMEIGEFIISKSKPDSNTKLPKL